MKKMLVLILIITVLITTSACSSRSSDTQSAVEVPVATETTKSITQTQPPTAESGSTDVQPTAAATPDMQAFILEKLQGHHGIDRVLNANHTREEWNATLDRMIGYGAKLSEEDKQAIIDYLVNRQN